MSAVTRLAAAREAAVAPADKRAVHTVLSPLEGSVTTVREFYDAYGEAYELAKEHGVRGGLVIPHGYRPTQDTKEAFRGTDTPGGIWRYIRENDTDWREQVKWSPHFHVVGLGRYDEVTAGDSEADDGWVFHKVRSLERFDGVDDRDGYNDMARVVRYLLSHATFEKGESKAVVRWYGELAPGVFKPEEALSREAWNAIRENAETIVGGDDDRDDGELDEPDTCDRDECDGQLRTIFDAGRFLVEQRDRLDREQEHRLSVAFEWAVGDIQPPPGLKRPSTEAQARETFQELL